MAPSSAAQQLMRRCRWSCGSRGPGRRPQLGWWVLVGPLSGRFCGDRQHGRTPAGLRQGGSMSSSPWLLRDSAGPAGSPCPPLPMAVPLGRRTAEHPPRRTPHEHRPAHRPPHPEPRTPLHPHRHRHLHHPPRRPPPQAQRRGPPPSTSTSSPSAPRPRPSPSTRPRDAGSAWSAASSTGSGPTTRAAATPSTRSSATRSTFLTSPRLPTPPPPTPALTRSRSNPPGRRGSGPPARFPGSQSRPSGSRPPIGTTVGARAEDRPRRGRGRCRPCSGCGGG
jgi:hypothetical protein